MVDCRVQSAIAVLFEQEGVLLLIQKDYVVNVAYRLNQGK